VAAPITKKKRSDIMVSSPFQAIFNAVSICVWNQKYSFPVSYQQLEAEPARTATTAASFDRNSSFNVGVRQLENNDGVTLHGWLVQRSWTIHPHKVTPFILIFPFL
jgi:hypothetical protein